MVIRARDASGRFIPASAAAASSSVSTSTQALASNSSVNNSSVNNSSVNNSSVNNSSVNNSSVNNSSVNNSSVNNSSIIISPDYNSAASIGVASVSTSSFNHFSANNTSASNTSASMTPTDFPRFPDLPTELRLVIWHYAREARLVIWGYSGASTKPPAVCQANRESREATRKSYLYYKRPPAHIKNKKYLLLVDMEKDVLYRRCAFPKSKVIPRQTEDFYIPPCKATDWIQNLRHLAINLDDAISDEDIWHNLCFICPGLKELIIVCGPKPKCGDTLDGFVETTAENEIELGDCNEARIVMMDLIEVGLQNEQDRGLFLDLELTFLKKRSQIPCLGNPAN